MIDDDVASGQSAFLMELEAKVSPESVFAKGPGIGSVLAQRIVSQLNISTLRNWRKPHTMDDWPVFPALDPNGLLAFAPLWLEC